MQQTNAPIDAMMQTHQATLQTKKCHICELDRYLSEFVYLRNDFCIESNICLPCRNTLNREKRKDNRILKQYDFL